MELLQLRYFYKIAHSRTLTQAADELCISQSSLSRMIGRLEDEFEMEFFDRKGRKIELNENGRIFLRYCTQILNAVDSMRDELSEMKNRRDMAVSVGFYSMSSLIVDIMGKFKERYPNIMLMYGKEASNRKQEIDRQHYTIPNQRPKDKHCGKI